MKEIIVATDFSEAARKALPLALELASKLSATITLIHVLEEPMPSGGSPLLDFDPSMDPNIRKELKETAESKLQELAKNEFNNIPVKSIVIESLIGVSATIADFARETKSDLIILTSHGRSGIARTLFGSVAAELVKLSPCPILTVPVRSPE